MAALLEILLKKPTQPRISLNFRNYDSKTAAVSKLSCAFRSSGVPKLPTKNAIGVFQQNFGRWGLSGLGLKTPETDLRSGDPSSDRFVGRCRQSGLKTEWLEAAVYRRWRLGALMVGTSHSTCSSPPKSFDTSHKARQVHMPNRSQ